MQDMSNFIVPISSLPSISSISSLQNQQSSTRIGEAGAPFADFLQQALENVAQTKQVSQADTLGLALGNADDLHTGSIAAVKSAAAVDFASGLVSAAIRSYNEIMRMQI